MSVSFPINGLRVSVAGKTDVGRKRSHNEDAMRLPIDDRLVIVADGMGGHECGDVASRLAVDTVSEFFSATADEVDVCWPFKFDHDHLRHENRLVSSVKLANLRIFERARRESQRMGTTLVAGLFSEEGEGLLAHVGDSRIYRLRDGRMLQLTEDHSLLNDYIKMKRLSPEEAERFPHKNVIVRALGMSETVAVDVLRVELTLGDVFLFCSDGLCGMLSDDKMHRIVNSHLDLDTASEKLVEAANAAGGVDNITVALARVES